MFTLSRIRNVAKPLAGATFIGGLLSDRVRRMRLRAKHMLYGLFHSSGMSTTHFHRPILFFSPRPASPLDDGHHPDAAVGGGSSHKACRVSTCALPCPVTINPLCCQGDPCSFWPILIQSLCLDPEGDGALGWRPPRFHVEEGETWV